MIIQWGGGGGGWLGGKNCDWLLRRGGGGTCWGGGIGGFGCSCWGIIGWVCGRILGGSTLRKNSIGGILGGGILKFGNGRGCWEKFPTKRPETLFCSRGPWSCPNAGHLLHKNWFPTSKVAEGFCDCPLHWVAVPCWGLNFVWRFTLKFPPFLSTNPWGFLPCCWKEFCNWFHFFFFFLLRPDLCWKKLIPWYTLTLTRCWWPNMCIMFCDFESQLFLSNFNRIWHP